MKFYSMNGPSESEVESLLMSPCWGPTQNGSQDQYLLDGHKLLLEHDLDSLPSDSEQKNSLDVLDNLLLNTSSLNALSDLKPLPPFTGYTGHLSINGISGHHYHAIAQRLPDESNNNYIQSAYQTNHSTTSTTTGNASTSIQLAAATSGTSPLPSMQGSGAGGGGGANSHGSSADHNIVSSSTCLPESVLSPDADACLGDVKLFADSQLDNKLYSMADSCVMSAANSGSLGGGGSGSRNGHNANGMVGGGDHGPDSMHSGVRIYTDAKDLSEYVDMNSIDDIAAIIGSAIADTTVPNQLDKDDGNDTRDSWMDLDAWIDGNCIQQDGKLLVSQQDTLSEFILPHSPVHPSSSTLQSLLTHGYMPLLHNRLQNGPPQQQQHSANTTALKSEAPSSTSYCNELPTASSTSSPPGSVVSTTDNLMINPRYLTNQHQYQVTMSSMKSDGLCSPDMLGNYPHTTTITPTGTPKTKRSRSQKKSSQQQQAQANAQSNSSSGVLGPQQLNAISPSSVSFSANDLSGLLGKEKPVHRCSICNRGFLNKSNIKVHLRTHTGEKPFRCDVCAKAFRQKAHLLKHQQIHKRIGRD
ncbi:PREDICTED: transcriptional regulator CRZ1 [Rhagoletis zephyria]|uniref:transcriptional regulator CRZ1 n=1 Tax=Rhagoletis zephyria TaxID=28612 RepID=UPI0008113827|nr:PREDICTED: transcriptional regulator CRZ1 [Rhagoletis zephyria]